LPQAKRRGAEGVQHQHVVIPYIENSRGSLIVKTATTMARFRFDPSAIMHSPNDTVQGQWQTLTGIRATHRNSQRSPYTFLTGLGHRFGRPEHSQPSLGLLA
jgi:hypothetical protein